MKIVPAPLEPTIDALSTQLYRLTPYFHRFSIDVLDGISFPSKTASITDITTFLKENKTEFKDVIFDFDLMISHYQESIEAIADLTPDIQVGNVVILRTMIKSTVLPVKNSFSIGLSLDIQDEVNDLVSQFDLNTIPCIQIMTVQAGAQGQAFKKDMLNKIQQLRALDYRNIIYIDGSVNKETLPVILSQKEVPDFACVGSFLTKSGDALEEHVRLLKEIEY